MRGAFQDFQTSEYGRGEEYQVMGRQRRLYPVTTLDGLGVWHACSATRTKDHGKRLVINGEDHKARQTFEVGIVEVELFTGNVRWLLTPDYHPPLCHYVPYFLCPPKQNYGFWRNTSYGVRGIGCWTSFISIHSIENSF